MLDAGLHIIGMKGFAGATTKEIALAAGVNEVTLFRTFKNKMGLFDAIIKERSPRPQLLKEMHFDRNLEVRKVLVDNALRLLNILHANRDLVRVLVLDLPRLERMPRYDPISDTFTGPLSGYLASQKELGRLRDIDPEAAAEMLYGSLRSFFIDTYLFQDLEPDRSSDRRFINTVVSIYLDGILAGREEQRPTTGRKRTK
jgi:AcrR family transcriptional regulator